MIADHVRLSSFKFQIIWTKGHATAEDVETNRVRADFNQLNHGADGLAGKGSRLHSLPGPVEAAAQFRITRTRIIQAMLSTVLSMRQRTLPTVEAAETYTAEQMRIRADWLADLATTQQSVCQTFLQSVLGAGLALPAPYRRAVQDSLNLSKLQTTVESIDIHGA